MNNILTILNLFNDAIFVSLVNTTLQMTLLIPLIALVIWVFRIKSPTTRYSLWLFVIFGIIVLPLLTPFIPQLDFAYSQRATGEDPDDLMRLRMRSGNVGEPSDSEASAPSTSATKTTVNKEADVSLFNPVSVAYFLWCAGALFMFWITLDAYRRLKKLSISSPDVKDTTALEMLSRLKGKLKIRRTIALKASSEIYTPISLGVLSPTIILPDGVTSSLENPPSPPFDKGGKGEISPYTKGEISPPLENINPAPPLKKGVGGISELEMILTHELAHIKRCDYLINFLQNMLRAIFFFHPLFHFASRNLTREREHICDDWVIDMTKQRGGYAECIISLLEKALYKPVNIPVAIAMAERKRDIPRRIDMIMDKKRKITAKVSKKALIAMLLIGCLSLPVIGGIELVRFAGARTASNEGRIVFGRKGGVWVMDANGGNERQISDKGGWALRWSPDGKQIAFSYWEGGNCNIFVMNASGTDMRQLTNTDQVSGFNYHPSWSPDGKQIVFGRDVLEKKGDRWEFKRSGIHIIDADGSNERKLMDAAIIGPFVLTQYSDWSPDGRKIAFTDCDFNGTRGPRIWVMDAVDGGNLKMLNDWAGEPGWSPDGKKIVFVSTRAGWAAWQSSDIYVMDADGSNVKILTNPGPSSEDYPVWSPDGDKIAFCDWEEGNNQADIYVMDADGSNVQRLTNTPADEWVGDWTAFSYSVEPTGKLKTTWGKIKQKLFGK